MTKLNYTTPWVTVHTYMIGPRKVQLRLSKMEQILTRKVNVLTIVDRSTAWPEFITVR